jgi:transcriptional regulator with XRE-family HTH domain
MEVNSETLRKIRDDRGMSQKDFAEYLGISPRSLQNYEAGSAIPAAKKMLIASKIDANYVNSAQEQLAKEPDAVWVDFNKFMMVPVVGHRAQAGFLSGWGDPEYLEELPKIPFEVDKEYKGRYVCFEVAGESMDNGTVESILENDVLLCREIQRHHWQNKLHINSWDFVVVHKSEGILVKRIIKHDTDKGELVLHSLNPYYDDQTVYMDDLIAIFNVVDIKRSGRRR